MVDLVLSPAWTATPDGQLRMTPEECTDTDRAFRDRAAGTSSIPRGSARRSDIPAPGAPDGPIRPRGFRCAALSRSVSTQNRT